MSEHDWEVCADPLRMLDQLYPIRGIDSVEPQCRKSRLYLLACGRAAWDRLPGVCRAVVAAGERVYHGRVTDRRVRDEVYPHAEGLVCCRGEAEDVNAIGRELVRLGHAAPADVRADADVPPDHWVGYSHLAFYPFYRSTPYFPRVPPDLHSAHLVREVFGNPLARRPPPPPRWLTSRVVDLAREADGRPNFTILPYLADALQDEGCDRGDVLDHLRGPGPHVRGCWVLEDILDARPAGRDPARR